MPRRYQTDRARSGVLRGVTCSFVVAANLISIRAHAATYYVAPGGDDNANTGADNSPFASMTRAQAAAGAGDTVYFHGGTYAFSSSTADRRRRPVEERLGGKPHQVLGLSG